MDDDHIDTLLERGATWKSFPLRMFSIGGLVTQVKEHQAYYYVWPYEGQWKNDKWVFHKGTVMDGKTEIEAPTTPLLVDVQSANAFTLVYEAVNDKNKAKLCEYVQSRGLFCWAMEALVWPNVSYGGRHDHH